MAIVLLTTMKYLAHYHFTRYARELFRSFRASLVIIDRADLHFIQMIFHVLKDMHVVVVATLSMIVSFARKMSQRTSH